MSKYFFKLQLLEKKCLNNIAVECYSCTKVCIKGIMKTIQKTYIVDRTKIGFVKFIFEAYEGIAVVSTVDAKKNLIMLSVAPDLMEESDMVVNDLKKDFLFEEAQFDEV